MDGFRAKVVESIINADLDGGTALLQTWADANGYERLAEEVIIPVLDHFTAVYVSSDESPLARGYVAAKLAERGMQMILDATSLSTRGAEKGVVVIGNIEDDFHSLGRRIVGTFLTSHGWDVRDMGNDVPATDFVDKALEVGASVIGASAMMLTTAMNIAKLREEIDRRGLRGKLQLAVGGAIFILRPELVAEVGGDGTAKTAISAPALFDELAAKAAVWRG